MGDRISPGGNGKSETGPERDRLALSKDSKANFFLFGCQLGQLQATVDPHLERPGKEGSGVLMARDAREMLSRLREVAVRTAGLEKAAAEIQDVLDPVQKRS